MIVTPILQRTFEYNLPYIEHIGQVVKETLISYCENNEFAFIPRFKTLDSIAEKIESGRFEKWSDIDDTFACTVIIPNLDYEKDVIIFLRSVFNTITVVERDRKYKAPDVFRFDSTRFVGNLKSVEGQEDNPIYKIPFEIQIRTAFEHAWAVTTHSLTYKSDIVDWKRYRLAAQLKASVEQMDMLVLGFDEATKYLYECDWPETAAKKEIVEVFKKYFSEGLIHPELMPRDWTRFSDNIYKLLTSDEKYIYKNPISKNKHINICVDRFYEEILKLGPEKVPRSISLIQFVFGVLSECCIINPPLINYRPNITDELLDLYPSVKRFENFFAYNG